MFNTVKNFRASESWSKYW